MNNMKRNSLLLVSVLALIVVMVFPVIAQPQSPVNPNDGINILEAETIALESYPNAIVIRIERVIDPNDSITWRVTLNNGVVMNIDGTTGTIIEDTPVEIGADGVDLNEARQIALRYYPNAQVIEIELVTENGIQAWDVMLDNGMAVYIHAETGAVIEFEPWERYEDGRHWRDDDDDDDDDNGDGQWREGRGGPPPWAGIPGGRRAWENQRGGAGMDEPVGGGNQGGAALITFERAREIALAQYPGTTLIEGELTRRGPRNGGQLAWDMKLSNGMAVYVDASTGAILELEPWR